MTHKALRISTEKLFDALDLLYTYGVITKANNNAVAKKIRTRHSTGCDHTYLQVGQHCVDCGEFMVSG